MLILLMKIVNSITWIQNHILQIHDEYNKLRRISDDIYTQGLRITTSIDEIGNDPNAEEFTDDEAMLDARDWCKSELLRHGLLQ